MRVMRAMILTAIMAPLALGVAGCVRLVDNEIDTNGDPAMGQELDREDIPERGVTEGRDCTTDGLSAHIGKTATAALGQELLDQSNAARLRWIQPGTAVTMDYRTDRLNVKLDARNTITGFSCG